MLLRWGSGLRCADDTDEVDADDVDADDVGAAEADSDEAATDEADAHESDVDAADADESDDDDADADESHAGEADYNDVAAVLGLLLAHVSVSCCCLWSCAGSRFMALRWKSVSTLLNAAPRE